MGWYVDSYVGCQELDEGTYVVTGANELSKCELIDTIVELCNIAKINLATDDTNDIIVSLKEQIDCLTHANTRLQRQVKAKDEQISELKQKLDQATYIINNQRDALRKCEHLAREKGINIYESKSIT